MWQKARASTWQKFKVVKSITYKNINSTMFLYSLGSTLPVNLQLILPALDAQVRPSKSGDQSCIKLQEGEVAPITEEGMFQNAKVVAGSLSPWQISGQYHKESTSSVLDSFHLDSIIQCVKDNL